MLPLLAMDYLVNSLPISVKLFRKIGLALTGGISSPNFKNLFVGKYRHSVLGAYHRLESALRHLVVYIVLIRPHKQVRRIYARWNIASMQNVKTVRNRPEEIFPASPVHHHFLSGMMVSDESISLAICVAEPDPAPRLRNSLGAIEKSFCKSHFSGHILPRCRYLNNTIKYIG